MYCDEEKTNFIFFRFMLVLVCLMLSVLPSDEIDTVDNNNKVLLPLVSNICLVRRNFAKTQDVKNFPT